MPRRPATEPTTAPTSRTTRRRSTVSTRRRRRRGTRGIRSAVSGRARKTLGTAKAGAERSLQRFKQATVLAVAITSLIVLVVPGAEEGAAQPAPQATDTTAAETLRVESVEGDSVTVVLPAAQVDSLADAAEPGLRADSLARETTVQAQRAFAEIWNAFLRGLPKLVVALLMLALAWLVVRLVRPLIRALLGQWEKASAVTALFGIGVWLIFISIAVGVIAGDFRALLGSLGLVGLALSWALQTPIESFTGWLLNSFQGYYRVGDRIAVGDVFGDVYRIDFLTTTVWEYGGPDRPPSFIQAEQATGRLITFPNNEVLTGSIVNYTRDFGFVWDELAVAVAPESDIRYAAEVAERVATGLLPRLYVRAGRALRPHPRRRRPPGRRPRCAGRLLLGDGLGRESHDPLPRRRARAAEVEERARRTHDRGVRPRRARRQDPRRLPPPAAPVLRARRHPDLPARRAHRLTQSAASSALRMRASGSSEVSGSNASPVTVS
jgi:hypothetical protein